MASKKGFTAEEREAMREYARERAASGKKLSKEEAESQVLAKIGAMAEPDKSMARRVHAIVMKSAPSLVPRLWYGMPAYSLGEKTICWFQGSLKFKARYSMLGFSDKANLDDGALWPVAYAIGDLTAAAEKEIAALVKRAVG